MKALGLIGAILTFIPLGIQWMMKGFANLNGCKVLAPGKPCLINGTDQSAILTLPFQEPWLDYSGKAMIVGGVLMAVAFIISSIQSYLSGRESKRLISQMDSRR